MAPFTIYDRYKVQPGTCASLLSAVYRNGANSQESFEFRQLSQGCKFTSIKMEMKLHCFFDGLIQIIRLAIKTNLPIRFWSPCFP